MCTEIARGNSPSPRSFFLFHFFLFQANAAAAGTTRSRGRFLFPFFTSFPTVATISDRNSIVVKKGELPKKEENGNSLRCWPCCETAGCARPGPCLSSKSNTTVPVALVVGAAQLQSGRPRHSRVRSRRAFSTMTRTMSYHMHDRTGADVADANRRDVSLRSPADANPRELDALRCKERTRYTPQVGRSGPSENKNLCGKNGGAMREFG